MSHSIIASVFKILYQKSDQKFFGTVKKENFSSFSGWNIFWKALKNMELHILSVNLSHSFLGQAESRNI